MSHKKTKIDNTVKSRAKYTNKTQSLTEKKNLKRTKQKNIMNEMKNAIKRIKSILAQAEKRFCEDKIFVII